jgi:hypothetical protein
MWQDLISRNKGNAMILSYQQAKDAVTGNPYYDIPQRSLFTLCPRGNACWSFRVFESILCGSVPVILSDSYLKPFSEFIPWDYFSITLPESYIASVDDLLAAIRPETVDALLLNLEKNQHWFVVSGLLNLIAGKLRQKVRG